MPAITRKETFAKRLLRLREEKGLSQRDIQSKGVSYAYISRLEMGQRTASIKAIRMLANKLGVTALYLETGQEAYCPHCDRYLGQRFVNNTD
jgi:transcriptional regulator with XRE-family HTH domain